ncbi:hypothetical protein K503DRAFT_771403 [Rhizopogon vinicolor AM-OR11-026]|uniref:Uncharacterized protein n=1 Tax=Rhizopogon vinicolor AM-OR11-026 TaxID=1314800 RepID=A0A1B7MY90_9AGAM|nr:hypothetical protein K503DRAFT_771403 [Rhizopogon vinicolor AM-OR11-026]
MGTGNDTGTRFFKPPPTVEEAELTFGDIKRILRPLKNVASYKNPELDSIFRRRVET